MEIMLFVMMLRNDRSWGGHLIKLWKYVHDSA